MTASPATPTLTLTAAAWETIARDCVGRRPDEACGLLIGNGNGVVRVVAVANVWPEPAERGRRFAIDPLTQAKAEAAAVAAGDDLVGFYHSHPTGPAVPSAFDLGRAWPGYVYLIVGFDGLIGPTPRAWGLDENGTFREHAVRII